MAEGGGLTEYQEKLVAEFVMVASQNHVPLLEGETYEKVGRSFFRLADGEFQLRRKIRELWGEKS